MKTLKDYIFEDDNDVVSLSILKQEYEQSKFPKDMEINDEEDSTLVNLPYDNDFIKEIGNNILQSLYGNIKNNTPKEPQASMFNSQHVNQLVANDEIKDSLVKQGVIKVVKQYLEKPKLGIQDICYLTKKGRKYFDGILK